MCKHFHSRKCIWKCCLPDSGYFVLASMCWVWSDTNIFKDNNSELEEMTACRHLKSPSHYPIDPYTSHWSPKGQGHTCGQRSRSHCCFTSISPAIHEIHLSKNLPLENPSSMSMTKVKINAYIWGQIFNPHVCISLCGNQIHFWLRYSKFHLWPWKCKVKVMAKVKSDGHIWGLVFNRYICFLFLWESDHFWLIYSTFHIWPWKFKVRVTSKINQNLIR